MQTDGDQLNIWYILLTIVTFSLLILIHETGHFMTARAFGVTVREFAIGMGPKLISHKSKKNGIVYSLRAFPIGGFVTMAGEDEDSEDENALNKKPVWKRMVITAAGAVMNIILGIILMLVVVTSSPRLSDAISTTRSSLSARESRAESSRDRSFPRSRASCCSRLRKSSIWTRL